MGWNNLKAAIAAVIKTNDNQEITGANLQNVLLSLSITSSKSNSFKSVDKWVNDLIAAGDKKMIILVGVFLTFILFKWKNSSFIVL